MPSDDIFFERIELEPKITTTIGDPEEFFESLIESRGSAVKDEKEKEKMISDFKKYLMEKGYPWKDWRYKVMIKVPLSKGNKKKEEMIDVEINLLQAAVLKKNIKLVTCITNWAKEIGFLDVLLKHKMECTSALEDWKLKPCSSWIMNATTIHLATCWHLESLAHFLEIRPNLTDVKMVDVKGNEHKLTPHHVDTSRKMISDFKKDTMEQDSQWKGWQYNPLHGDTSRKMFSDVKKNMIEQDSPWKDWRYKVRIKVPLVNGNKKKEEVINVEINLLQAAVIKKNIKLVTCITNLAKETGFLDDLLKHKMECTSALKDWKLGSYCSWILDATTIHLATCWHLESLAHFLKIRPNLRDAKMIKIKTKEHKFTPLHVAASCNNAISARLLISKGANANAKNDEDKTPLHIASQEGYIKTVITLLFEGSANVMAKDIEEKTPLHLAKTSKIIDILLAKTNAEEVNKLNLGNQLFEHILDKQPESIQTFLDMLVTKEPEKDHYVFHLDMFKNYNSNKKDKKKANMEAHLNVINAGQTDILLHPVMKVVTDLKWHPHKTWYYSVFIIFVLFLISFTCHAINTVNYLQCQCDRRPGFNISICQELLEYEYEG